jgi:lipopolysaccharide biosynthesis regulator YciM
MRAKTLVTILAVFAFVWFVVATIRLNEVVVETRIPLLQPLSVELWMVMFAAFFAGALIILLLDVASGARRLAEGRRLRLRDRARAEIEDLYFRGLEAMANGEHEKAVRRFDLVLECEAEHEGALVKKGDSLRALKRYREAAEILERATRLSPDNIVAHYSLTDVYLDAGVDDRARAVLKEIIERQPDTAVSAHRKLRDLLVSKLEWEAAYELQRKLVSLVTAADEKALEQETLKGVELGLGAHLLASGKAEESARVLNELLDGDELFVPAYVRLGETLAASGDPEGAITTWRRGYEVTGSTEALTALQNFYLRDELPEEAISVWKQALVLSDNEVPLRYCLGKLYYRLFMLDEALHEFQMIEDRVAGLPALHLFMARVLESKGELSQALAKTKLLVAEVEGLVMDHVCSDCEWRLLEWSDRCPRCKRWGTIALHLPRASTPEPTIQPAPTWSS